MLHLPAFQYHPDPITTGVVELSGKVCVVCGIARGAVYTGPVYTSQTITLDEQICPWCIAIGAAYTTFDVCFTDPSAIGSRKPHELISEAVRDEIAYRTPGFAAWQSEYWLTHCGDAMALIAIAGRPELLTLGETIVAIIRAETGYDDDEWRLYFAAMDRNHGPTAYVFRCLHCGAYDGYSDCL